MDSRHVAVNSRPSANSKARRTEKEIPDWKPGHKRNDNSKKDAGGSIVHIRDISQQRLQQQPRQSAKSSSSLATRRRRRGRLRSPSLPSISEGRHDGSDRGNDDDHPKAACPIVPPLSPHTETAARPLPPRSTASSTSSVSEAAAAAAVQELRKSNEALLDLVTELISLVPTHFPVHEVIRRREEARELADMAYFSAAVVEIQGKCCSGPTTTLEEVTEKEARKAPFVKGHHPRSKSSIFSSDMR
ncbi:uncharacterized protein PG986_010483 [Apiospora aurea]|uniref:Uncharacterized protein n=1 Tax=Apiospora aurea TaxID=335848 RepID=A0ABR1Q2J5_9PEZI